jgi:hypothetical protein
MKKTVAKKTVSTKKVAKRAQAPAARKASAAKQIKPAKKPSPKTMDALEFFAYTYSRF